jgi:putative redox protein
MVAIDIVYEGELRCSATHAPSASVLTTDAPKDNHGKGESFSPTDLVATALGSCMLTIMGIAARTLQLDITGTTVQVVKEMVTSPVRRIGALRVVIHVPITPTAQQQEALHKAAISCPVHQSVHPDIAMPITFTWG